MKKALKITLITLAVIIVLGIAACIFTGIVPYFLAKGVLAKNTDIAYSEWAHYDAGTIQDHKTVSYEGLYMDVPPDMENYTDKDGKVRENVFNNKKTAADGLETAVIITNRQTVEMPSVSEMFSDSIGEMSDTDRKKAEKAIAVYEREFSDYCSKLGRPAPNDRYSYMDILFRTDSNTWNVLDKKQTVVKTVLLTMKSMLAEPLNGEAYHFETDAAAGYISPYGDNRDKYMIEVFDMKDPDTSYTVIVSAPDEDTMYKMINSVRIDYKEE